MSATSAPYTYDRLQEEPQSIPAGTLVTVPAPLPLFVICIDMLGLPGPPATKIVEWIDAPEPAEFDGVTAYVVSAAGARTSTLHFFTGMRLLQEHESGGLPLAQRAVNVTMEPGETGVEAVSGNCTTVQLAGAAVDEAAGTVPSAQ